MPSSVGGLTFKLRSSALKMRIFAYGNVRVWSLSLIFDDQRREEADRLYEHIFSEHILPVTNIVCGVARHNAIIVSVSKDCNCKVLALSEQTSNVLLSDVFDPHAS
ncbi:hypothetical protein QQ045_017423 [Rhodiola kirilowii]